jgi:hypothetical protein
MRLEGLGQSKTQMNSLFHQRQQELLQLFASDVGEPIARNKLLPSPPLVHPSLALMFPYWR